MAKGSPLPAEQKGLLDRGLSLFTDVRAGEGVGALLLATNVFYLLAFYQVLKIVRDALILSESGAVAASYASAGMAAVLFVFVPAYGALASRVNRVWLISGVTVFFASHLLIFYALGSAGAKIGVAFYIWVGVFNMVAVAQFWAFANDLYTTERGKRLFPLVGIGASMGALVGAGLTAYFFKGMGPYSLMLIAAFGLLVPVALTIVVHKREGHRKDAKKEEAEKPVGGPGGFTLVFKQRYLLYIAMLVLVYNLVNTLGGFMLNQEIEQEATRVAAATAGATAEQVREIKASVSGTLSGTVGTYVNLLAFLLQAFFVSRIFKYVGVRGALFILPVIAATGYTAVALIPILMTIQWTKIFENSTDYSIQNTTRQALFLPTSREAKYKAKQAIDSFFVRFGDMLQAGVVFVGVQLALTVRGFALVNLVLIGVWLLIVLGIRREHQKLTGADTMDEAA
ncbi:MAG TPA: Npt1/Npt2 family nucleotide transporter [Vicinamibacterales bacterium]|nr:Npt1/Npt2 family nucleotide transporter [Vicinamibacterales bacterium]